MRERRRALLAAASAAISATFVVRPSVWLAATSALVIAFGAVAMLPSWRGTSRDARRLAGDAAIAIGVAMSLPLLFAIAATFAGTLPAFVRDVDAALPRRPIAALVEGSIATLIVVLVLDGIRADRRASSLLPRVVAIGIAAALALRVAWIASIATLPTEVFWAEAPLLVNALKLDAGEALYGPTADLSSYTYSPLLDLAHHAILTPLHAELSVFANRVVVFVEQLAAIAVFAFALRPRLRVDALLVIALAALANLLAPAMHPDHGLLLCFAIAVALLVAESRWPRALWWIALVSVAPIATAFKLSGAGIGVGLFVAFALERRWRVVAALAASGGVAIAELPLFDVTLGRFRLYAIDVQASHPIVWSRLADLPTTPAGLVLIAAIAMHLALRYGAGARTSTKSRRVAVLTAFVSLASLPAYLKYGGRDNNIALLVLGAIVTMLLRARDAAGRAPHPSLAPAIALLATLLYRPLTPPATSAQRSAAFADFDRALAAVRDADARGAHALLLVQTTPWIAAGHRDVPRDRFHSAVELFYGGHPEADALFAHIADGRYDTVVVGATQLRAGTDLQGQFCARLRKAIERDYDLEGSRALDAVEGIAVFRRRVTSR